MGVVAAVIGVQTSILGFLTAAVKLKKELQDRRAAEERVEWCVQPPGGIDLCNGASCRGRHRGRIQPAAEKAAQRQAL